MAGLRIPRLSFRHAQTFPTWGSSFFVVSQSKLLLYGMLFSHVTDHGLKALVHFLGSMFIFACALRRRNRT
jgi:hypothetical protein